MVHVLVRTVAVLFLCLSAFSAVPVRAAAISAADDVVDVLTDGKVLLRGRAVAKIPYSDLGKMTKLDNVEQLLGIGMDELKLTDTQAIRLRPVYLSLDNGDQLLLTCLKHSACDPEIFASIANTSPLHAEIVRRAPQLDLVHVNQEIGALTERLMHRYFESSGWTRLEGQLGRAGVDGLYVKLKDGVVHDVLLAECKYNTSALADTMFGAQMSQTWVQRKLTTLQQYYPEQGIYKEIGRFVEAGSYRARLWNLKVDDDAVRVTVSNIRSKGAEVEMIPLNGTDLADLPTTAVNSFKFNAPKNSFEELFLRTYRTELDAIAPVELVR